MQYNNKYAKYQHLKKDIYSENVMHTLVKHLVLKLQKRID